MGCICLVYCIVYIVHVGADAICKRCFALAGDGAALLNGYRVVGLPRFVSAHLHDHLHKPAEVPAVYGMGLADVDGEELHAVVVLLVEVVETHGSLGIWWSGKAAEYKRNRAFVSELV